MRLPLDPNRNHQQTAFAGSLNALCTIAGWGSVYLLLRGTRSPRQHRHPPQHDQVPGAGNIVGDLRPLPARDRRGAAIFSGNARRQGPGQARPDRRSRGRRWPGRFVQRLVRGAAATAATSCGQSLPNWHANGRLSKRLSATLAAANLAAVGIRCWRCDLQYSCQRFATANRH